MAPHRGNYKSNVNNLNSVLSKEELLDKYLKEFRVEQCPLFLQHKCQQHRPFTCFNWHFQNQRRRRPLRRRDGTFNYSADVYCSKYDETTGICPDIDDCPYLHRTAGDTERRYHLKYYKTGMCVHDTDNRGYCVKNGPHCAFAHGNNDLRPPVYDVRELQAIESGETDPVTGLNSLDRERSLVNDDPKWLDTTFVLANYKTELCKKPPRLCRQGYACPQYHNGKDKRRSPKKYKYRSTPCPQVKSGDDWGDPGTCDAGENCHYCHTRTEQQFHPEIYKSTKCNDIQNTSYCPRGAFCAFAHIEQETISLESSNSPPELSSHSGGHPQPPPNLGEFFQPDGNNKDEIIRNEISNAVSAHFATRAAGGSGGPPVNPTLTQGQSGLDRVGSITPPFELNGVASPIETSKLKGGSAANGFMNYANVAAANNLSSSMSPPRTNNSITSSTSITNNINNNNNGSSGTLSSSVDSGFSATISTAGVSTNSQQVATNSAATNVAQMKNRFLSGGDLTAREAIIRRQIFAIDTNPNLSPMDKAQRKASLIMDLNNSGGSQNFALLGGPEQQFNLPPVTADSVDSLGIEELNIDLDGGKSRKSSGFSETTAPPANGQMATGTALTANKSRQASGVANSSSSSSSSSSKSRHCSGASNSQQITPTNSNSNKGSITNPVTIPNGFAHIEENVNGTQLGLFDLTTSSPKTSSSLSSVNNHLDSPAMAAKDLEIARLKEELAATRTRLVTWESEGVIQFRQACEVWKKEAVMGAKKAEVASRERDAAVNKVGQLRKELDNLSGGGPYLHAVKRMAELKACPLGVVKAIEWQLRKDLQEVEKIREVSESNNQQNSGWSPVAGHNRGLFDFNTSPSSGADILLGREENASTSGGMNESAGGALWGGGALGLIPKQNHWN